MPAFDAIGMDAIGASGSASQTATPPAPTPTVTGVVVSPASVTLQEGDRQQFSAVVNGDNSPSQAVTWTGSRVDANGLFTAPAAISSVQIFTATATSTQDGNYSGTATVTILAVLPHVAPPSFSSTIHTRARHRGRR